MSWRPLHPSSVGHGPGPAPRLGPRAGPRQLTASSGASLQHFGGGIQAGLPPALGAFKEAELWGGTGHISGVGRVDKACLPFLLSLCQPSSGFFPP